MGNVSLTAGATEIRLVSLCASSLVCFSFESTDDRVVCISILIARVRVIQLVLCFPLVVELLAVLLPHDAHRSLVHFRFLTTDFPILVDVTEANATTVVFQV